LKPSFAGLKEGRARNLNSQTLISPVTAHAISGHLNQKLNSQALQSPARLSKKGA
jgi:hypothetical protein